jgi:MoxR-like ATPase
MRSQRKNAHPPLAGTAEKRPARAGSRKVHLTRSLDVHGWSHLDPVLLASLASESPLLLVGPHGTAKSLLVERISSTLGLTLRHYNASLLNYDDLVGIPLPEEDGSRLRFVHTPGAIWDAEFVFFDEISRCRADLQNKLFPIVHERRVLGIRLEKLRHCWAAMNPPSPEDPDTHEAGGALYLGSEPLDPALIDRFPFVVSVPGWNGLTKQERRKLVLGGGPSRKASSHEEKNLGIPDLVAKCADLIGALEEVLAEGLSDYVVQLVDLLGKARLPQSPRRARMLLQSILAVHAARIVLGGKDAALEESAELAVRCGLPENATEVPPSPSTVLAAHKQAWEVTSLEKDTAWRKVLEETDPVRRVVLADRLNLCDRDLSRIITQAIGEQENDARRVGLGTAMFLAFRERRDLDPSAWEPLVQLSRRVLEPRVTSDKIGPGPVLELWRQLNSWLAHRTKGDESQAERLERNYLLGGFPDLWTRQDWQEALSQFRADLALFGIESEREEP